MNYKEALYHFRNFAIRNGFIIRYMELSRLGLFKSKSINDIPKIYLKIEPVLYIQGAAFFCLWPKEEAEYWQEKSVKWMKYCLDNGLYYSKSRAEFYYASFIKYCND